MSNKPKTIFITISRGALVRTFFHTGVISHLLRKEVRVVVLIPKEYEAEKKLSEYGHKNLVFEQLITPKKLRLSKFILNLYNGVIFNKTVYMRYKYKFLGKDPSKLLFVPRVLFLAPLRFIPGSGTAIRFFDTLINSQREHDHLFEKYKPDVALATTARTQSDVGVLKSAKRFGTITAQMPKSWDNLSKTLFPVETDFLIVWGEFMKEQAIKFQRYDPAKVIMVGAPQFDFYVHNKEFLISRNEFCKKFYLDPKKKIILYGSTGLSGQIELDYVLLIKQLIDEGKLPPSNILVRPHIGHAGDTEKYEPLKAHGVFIDSTAKTSRGFKDHWDTSKEHIITFVNTLRHADVCVNVSSTVTIDALLSGTPAINIGFTIDSDTPLSESPARFFKTDYLAEIAYFGATWFATSTDEFKRALTQILEKGDDEAHTKKREAFFHHFVYKNDGNSAKRLADTVYTITAKSAVKTN